MTIFIIDKLSVYMANDRKPFFQLFQNKNNEIKQKKKYVNDEIKFITIAHFSLNNHNVF